MFRFGALSYLVGSFRWSWKWGFPSLHLFDNGFNVIFRDAVDIPAKLMLSLFWLFMTVRPGFPFLFLGLLFHWDADSSPVAYFAIYVACVFLSRTMSSAKMVIMSTIFFMPVFVSGEYYDLWCLSVIMIPVVGEVGWHRLLMFHVFRLVLWFVQKLLLYFRYGCASN